MSSFIIDKKEYIKAAGLMYGYEHAKRDPHEYFLSRVYKEFVRCYELNLTSVNEQYENYEQPDTEEYRDIFEEYKKIGEKLYSSSLKRKLAYSLWHFFRSALYQTENEEMEQEMRAWFFTCVTKLFLQDMDATSAKWWGEIKLDDLVCII